MYIYIYLYIYKVFEKVWYEGLLLKLNQKDVSGNLLHLL